jgi:hypothetical protein
MGKKHDVMSANKKQHMEHAQGAWEPAIFIFLENAVRLMASDSNAEGIEVAEACMATHAHSPNDDTSAMS